MKIEQIYTGCLAQGAYYITSRGEAAIIDPLRETNPYMQRLERDGLELKYIFETHFHADFVSGHLDLSQKTKAPIVYGPTAQPAFDAIIAEDGQDFKVGDLTLRVLHTPGHTMESTCYLLLDKEGKERALFTGDTLFLGDVGRPDLAQKAANMTREELAGLLYDSLYNKILLLPDDIMVYPAHGAGSACGKKMMDETVDTLGNQKKVNYALNQSGKGAFVDAVLDGLLPPPAYFGMNVAMNKTGYENFDTVMKLALNPLSPSEFESLAKASGALILDTRSDGDFVHAFVPQSINIGIDGDFAPWAGAMIVDVKHPILLVTDIGKEEESIKRLGRVGFDHVLGYLDGGFASWEKAGKEIDRIKRISVEQFAADYSSGNGIVFDVRRESEYKTLHIEGAYNRPLDYINEWLKDLKANEPFYLHCAGGYRAVIAASILQSRGYRNFWEVEGGLAAIEETDIPLTDRVDADLLFQ